MYNGELKTCRDIDTLKKLYYRYAKLCHPDHGGDSEEFKRLNNDYQTQFVKVKNIHVKKDGTTYTANNNEHVNDFMNIINSLISIPGLNIDIVGCFIWIGGNTKSNKEKLKQLGFKYSSKKQLWYKSPDGYKRSNYKKSYTYDEIIAKYGIQSSINTGAAKPHKQLAY